MSRHWDPALGWVEDHDWSSTRSDTGDWGNLVVGLGWLILLVIMLRAVLWP